jgi:superfamily II DNA or RNA helicase
VTIFTIGGGSPSGGPPGPSGNLTGLLRPDRDYQREAIDKVLGDWSHGHRALLLVLPTGAGKTVVSADIIRRVVQQTSQRAVFMAHRSELLTQSQDKIRLVAPQITTGLVQAQHDELSRQVTVASVQTVTNEARLQRLLQNGPYSLLVVDEAHHAASPSWARVIQAMRAQNPDMRVLGLTATPGRSDGLTLDGVFEKISFTKSVLELIEEKWLVYPRAFRVHLDIDLDVVGSSGSGDGKDLKDGDLAKLMVQQPVLDAVYGAYQQHGQGRTMIGFAVTVEHARLLAETFTARGVKSEYVAGDTSPQKRQELYANFRSGSTRVIFSCGVLTEGFDEPSAGGVLLARPTLSQALFIQMVGRGLRPFPTKHDCIVIDCAGNTTKHAIVQMSTLAGFEKFDVNKKDDDDTIHREKEDERDVVANSADAYGNEIRITDVRGATRESRYTWRQTDYGYVLAIPKIGYYLVAGEKHNQSLATIRYYDTRKTPDGKPVAPVSITDKPIDVNLAYGLVEAEAQRIVRAAMRAARENRPTSKQHVDRQISFDDHLSKVIDNLEPLLSDGIDDEPIDDHILMARTARWRQQPRTDAQTKLLTKLGVKVDNMPPTAGEASDLISVASVEKHQRSVRMHGEPATPKQRWYLRINQIDHDASISKAEAAKLIYKHRMRQKSSSH